MTWKDTHGVPAPIIGYKKGAKRKTPVIHEADGEVGGYQVEHYDGSQDAEIIPKTIGAKSKTMEGDGR